MVACSTCNTSSAVLIAGQQARAWQEQVSCPLRQHTMPGIATHLN